MILLQKCRKDAAEGVLASFTIGYFSYIARTLSELAVNFYSC